MKRSRLTKNMLKRLINEEIEKVEEAGMVVPYQDNPRRGGDSPAFSGGSFSTSGPNPDDAFSTQELFKLFAAGFAPSEVAGLDRSTVANHPRMEEIMSIISGS
jgi:hypothetical protein